MISKFSHTYDNLKPEHKALADMLGLLVIAIICTGIVAIVAHYGFWFEFCMALLVYGMYGLTKTLYEARVFHHTCQENTKDK